MYDLLPTYYYSTKNLRNFAFVCLFKGIFVVEYKRSGQMISIFGIWPDNVYIITYNSIGLV